jgi:hypothetical protein
VDLAGSLTGYHAGTTYPMVVPLKVFIKIGFFRRDAKEKKKLFGEQWKYSSAVLQTATSHM